MSANLENLWKYLSILAISARMADRSRSCQDSPRLPSLARIVKIGGDMWKLPRLFDIDRARTRQASEQSETYSNDETCIVHNFNDIFVVSGELRPKMHPGLSWILRSFPRDDDQI
jgi:hypothetical protein